MLDSFVAIQLSAMHKLQLYMVCCFDKGTLETNMYVWVGLNYWWMRLLEFHSVQIRLQNVHWTRFYVVSDALFTLTGKLCIEVSPADKIAFISEELCIGCGICAKVCLHILSYVLLCCASNNMLHACDVIP